MRISTLSSSWKAQQEARRLPTGSSQGGSSNYRQSRKGMCEGAGQKGRGNWKVVSRYGPQAGIPQSTLQYLCSPSSLPHSFPQVGSASPLPTRAYLSLKRELSVWTIMAQMTLELLCLAPFMKLTSGNSFA